jgi:serine O-acetyltransferase
MLEALRRDAARYSELGGWYRNLGFWVVATYRFGAWARGLPRPLGLPFRALHAVLRLPWAALLHVKLDAERIGPGFCLIHPHCVLTAAGTVIGHDCLIFHEVTLGTNIGVPGAPIIGDGVDLYVGARVLGNVSIGSGSIVGANCVVTQDVAPGSVVAPSPARAARRQPVASAGPPSVG